MNRVRNWTKMIVKSLHYFTSELVGNIVRTWVFIALPIIVVALLLSGSSRVILWAEDKVITGAQAMYVDAVDYVASTNGYVDASTIPVIETEQYQPFTYENFLTKVRKEMRVNELPDSLEPLILGLVYHESVQGNKNAVSKAGALGLFQLMPATIKKLNHNIEDVKKNWMLNVKLGVHWFAKMRDSNKGNNLLALHEYNAGINRMFLSKENKDYPHHVLTAMNVVYNKDAWKNIRE